jgi:hypothetical protein
MNDQKSESTWVYGVIPAGAKLEELKRRGDRLPSSIRVVEFADIGAIVGDAPGPDAKATRDQALFHARVLEAAVLDAPVVPFRFGTVVTHGSVSSDLLEPRHDEFVRLLESVKDYVQMTLKATYDESAVLAELIQGHPKIAQLREETRGHDEILTRDARVRLGELVSMALEQLRQYDAAAIIGRLNAASVASRMDHLESEFMVLNAPFLVERGRMHEFEDAAAAVADEQAERMRLTLLGPMPAFDFVPSREPSWA